MTHRLNDLGQPVGAALSDWTPPPAPPRTAMEGRLCRLEPLDPTQHGDDLYRANNLDRSGANWTYLPYGPFHTRDDYQAWLHKNSAADDPLFYAIVDTAAGTAAGIASYLRITPAHGTIEIGHLNFSPLLQRRPAATEAIYLLLQQAFDLGYRRLEWKCDSLNLASRRAAQRFGFSFEGIFRQIIVYKGRNRDTAWFSIIDSEWPAVRAAFIAWLKTDNFDVQGKQRKRLSELMPTPNGA